MEGIRDRKKASCYDKKEVASERRRAANNRNEKENSAERSRQNQVKALGGVSLSKFVILIPQAREKDLALVD